MKKIYVLLTLISALVANGISGVSYFRYTGGNFDNDKHSGFYIDRAYLTYKNTISDKSSFKFQSDIQNNGEAFYMYIKNVKMDYSLMDNTKISIGLQGMNIFNVQEKTWGYRFISKSSMDLNSWSASADLGLGLYQSFGNILLSVLYTNGEGYKKKSSDDHEKLSVQAMYGEKRLDKNDGFNLGGIFSTLNYMDNLGVDQRATIMGVFSGWAGIGARLGFEYNIGTDLNLEAIEDNDETDDDETEMYGSSSSLMSIYANYELFFMDHLSVLVRYDILDTGIANNQTSKLITGLSYKCDGGIIISPNMKQETVGDEDPMTSINLTFQLSF